MVRDSYKGTLINLQTRKVYSVYTIEDIHRITHFTRLVDGYSGIYFYNDNKVDTEDYGFELILTKHIHTFGK